MRNLSQVKTMDDHIATIKVIGSWCCWRLPCKLRTNGYAHLRSDGRNGYAHRLIYEHLIGPIMDGLTLDHLCRNRWCCHPNHLQPVTHDVNIMRGAGLAANNSQKKACPSGHTYDDNNTRVYRNSRYCRMCDRLRTRRRIKRLRQSLNQGA